MAELTFLAIQVTDFGNMADLQGSQPSTSALASVKMEEHDPIDSTALSDELQDPMDVLQVQEMTEIEVKVELQDGEPNDYVVETRSSSENSSSESESSDSDSDYGRGKRQKKRRKAKAKAEAKKLATARKISGGEDGSIILACNLCEEGFLVQELLDRHMAQKHDDRDRPFRCSECSKTYLTNGNLQEHIRMAHSGVKFTCKECGINLSTKSSWKRHMQGHTEEGYTCELCKEKFSSHTVLAKHRRRVHEKVQKNFICLECGSTYDDNASLREHRLSHTDIRRWECETCGMKFKRSHNLSVHRKTHLAQKKPVPTIKCQECDEMFTTKMALAAHRYVHGRYVCKICKRTFETQSGLMQHRKDDHKLIKHTGTECRTCHAKFQNSEELLEHRQELHANDPMLECDVCKARYPTPAALRTHQRYHDKVILYNCPNCPEAFNSQLLLDRHLKVDHKDKKNHICDLCGKGYPTKRQIAAHLIRHKNPNRSQSEPPGCHICDMCGKEFRFRMTLKRHVFNTHTNQNTFKCDQCDKVLASAEGLKLHQRSHSDDQSIMCELCGRSFLQPYRLKVHMESHMREGNDYRCHICSRTCRDPQKLEIHMKLHTGETQFHCTQCQRYFVTKRHYKLHMQRIHETEVKCLRCDKIFPTPKKMRLHIKIHDFPDYLECPKCYTCVKDKKTMARHMKQHENEGVRVPCQYCPLTFATKKTRRKHERHMHSDEVVQMVGHQMVDEEEEGAEDYEDEDEDMLAGVGEREDEVSVGPKKHISTIDNLTILLRFIDILRI
ncbi:AAEL002290-PA [Aedes aegypti]|uniref:AAEL002290-PA n=1 Tax=Aedes aegypti TaxID=7159 RepID=Q17IP4_AEDAE|nr:AAEL002290-PA [Aedes aegypti]